MKPILTICLFCLLASSCVTTQYTVDVPASVDAPKNVLFLGQSGTQDDLYQTVIDLKNNEIVILQYGTGYLKTVFRTQMKVNPDDYRNHAVITTDAPMKESDDEESAVPVLDLEK